MPPHETSSCIGGRAGGPSPHTSFKAPAAPAAPLPLRKTPDYEDYYSDVGKVVQPGILRSLVAGFANVPGVISMAGGLPPSDVFPLAGMTLRLADGSEVEVEGLEQAQQYNLTLHGLPGLRDWATNEVALRHRPASTVDTMISNGANHSLEMLGTVFLQRGDCIVLEEYHYPVVTEGITGPRGVEALGVEIDEDGIVPEALEAVLEARRASGKPMPKLLYTNPVAQNPTGAVVTRGRMSAVYALCRRYGLLILEDDPYYYLQYPYGPDAVPGTDLAPGYLSLDVDGRVVRVDTFAKMMAPGMRMGWITGPPAVISKLTSVISYSTAGPSTMSAAILLAVLRAWGPAGFEDHIRGLQRHYAVKAAGVHAAARRHLGALADWAAPTAGMFLWLRLRGVRDAADVWEAMRDAKVIAVPGGAMAASAGTPGFTCPHLRLSFSQNSVEEVEEGVRRLASVLHEEARARTGAPAAPPA